jgi:hypothetical protein
MAGLGNGAVQAADDAVPKRKPGLWEITTVSADTGTAKVKACIGPDDDIATPSGSGECTTQEVKRRDEEVTVNVVCKQGAGKTFMSTTFIGDFTTRYHGIMKITFDPPEGLKNMGVIIDGRYLGPDCKVAE